MRSAKFAASSPAVLPHPHAVHKPQLALEVIDPAACEDLWRSFEDQAICSPYQRFGWVRSYARSLAAEQGFSFHVLLLREDNGHPLLLLPLAVARRQGTVVASFVGGKQANFNLPITAPGLSATFPAEELKRLLLAAARDVLDVDAFVFLNQPLSWRGEPNPLAAFGGSPSANEGFKLSLAANPDQTLARAFSSETRKKMRKKTRLLGELGEVRFRHAQTPGDVQTILDAFFQQKQRRFRDRGIDNPFEGAMQAFIRRACLAGLDRGHPAIELYALSVGERIVATFGGTGDPSRLCGMFNSFDSGGEVNRCSPGELLLAEVIRRQCEIGRQIFDLGVGEARYKTALCDEIEELIDVFVPVTMRGQLYVMATQRLVAWKRFVKRTPWAWRAANLLRTAKAAFVS